MTSSLPIVQDITPLDSRFKCLFQFRTPAKHLYVKARPEALAVLERLPARGLGVVGTRAMGARSKSLIRKVVRELAGQDIVIVSGFARGVDRAAHEAALDYGLPTVAVVGSGFDCLYPPEHKDLAERLLAAGGVLVSEHPPQAPARPYQFLNRNRLIAQWSSAVWIVQAAHRSGALNTAAWAIDAQVPVFATPCFPGDPEFAGTQELLDAAKAQPLWGAHSLGSQWLEFATVPNPDPEATHRPKSATALLSADASQLYKWALSKFQSGDALTVSAGLEWALESGWTRERFFGALQAVTTVGKLQNRPGNYLIPE